MTPNRRIALNIIATYGRNLYSLVLGMFTARWALMALGQTDYGLMGLVGGLVTFVTILNDKLGAAVSRYYAVSVGAAKVDRLHGLETCRMWFTTAVVIHSILPLCLIVIGYPMGAWVVRNFLNIPPDRVVACVWLWRFVCFSCLFSMMSVPFCAMYIAKQEIAELTVYSVSKSTLNALFLFYMVTHDDIWLVKYALWTCLLQTTPLFVQVIMARIKFPECRFILRYANCWSHVYMLLRYAFFQLIAGISSIFRIQGVAILINKYFGPRFNAANAIGTNLAVHCLTFSGAMNGALAPAIMNAYGAGNLELVRRMAYRASKISVLLILVFAIPLCLEVDEVLILWLKNPPQYTGGLTICILFMLLFENLGSGHIMALNAAGKVVDCQLYFGFSLLLALPLAWWGIVAGYGFHSVGVALAVSMAIQTIGAIWFAHKHLAMSCRYMIKSIFIPLVVLCVICFMVGFLPHLFMKPSFLRVCATIFAVEVTFLPLAWAVVLNYDEKTFLRERLNRIIMRKCVSRLK